MRRLSVIGGLTVMLLLLLGWSAYCVWVTRALTADLDRLISVNYHKLRAIGDVRSAMSNINARYLSNALKPGGPVALGTFENESKLIYERLALIRTYGTDDLETKRFERMELLLKDFFTNHRLIFALNPADLVRRDRLIEAVFQNTADVGEHAEAIVALNEAAMFKSQQAAVERGQTLGWVTLGIAVVSLAFYVYTGAWLVRGIYRPLRQLRDGMQQVGERKFDQVRLVEGGEELTQIATTFNKMAAELRTYVTEIDQRSVEANRLSRAILDVLPYPIYIVDEDFKVVLENPRAHELSTGLEMPGHLPAAVRRCLDDATALGTELIDDDLHRAIEIPFPAKTDGPPPTFLPQIFKMASVPDSGDRWAVLLVDVTKLRQIDQAKTKAISTLGHELKTPVTSIRMVLHLLQEKKIGPLTPDQLELVGAGKDDCERLLTVLRALLELARFEGGQMEFKLVPAAPADLLAQAESMHGGCFRGSKTPFVVDPAPTSLPLVHADAVHVVRVLGNYISNAAKYHTPGSSVTMRAVPRADGFVRLSVRNHTSRPLSETDQMRVFEPFYRRPGEDAEGSGLGLAICREIAVLHRGRVGARVDGEHVEFYFDVRQVTASDQPATGSNPPASSPS